MISIDNCTLESVTIPEVIEDSSQLEDLLSIPSEGLIHDLSKIDGDIMILGVGGKVGPSLARMAKRAAPHKRVIGVARFSDPAIKAQLESWGVETIAADLLSRDSVQALPKVKNIVYMAGKKFGTAGSEPETWAMNAIVPTYVGEILQESRFVAFSTLCVYPFTDVHSKGSSPLTHPPEPVGEYPNSCVARERVLQYFATKSASYGRLARLNYAIDLRYGVLQDVALRVMNRQAIDIRTGVANVIWQGESTAHILRCLAHGTNPASPINIGSEESANIRNIAIEFGKYFGVEPIFDGQEEDTAWHNDTSEAIHHFGKTRISLDTMIRWNAHWLKNGREMHHKPTHYEQRRGKF